MAILGCSSVRSLLRRSKAWHTPKRNRHGQGGRGRQDHCNSGDNCPAACPLRSTWKKSNSDSIALERTQPGLPLGQGHIRTRTHDYYRHGTVTLFAALDYLSGKVFAHTAPRHRHQEWLAFLRKIDKEVAPELGLHIICDNYSTHKHAKVTAWLKRHPRFHLHFTPTSSSWLNLVERFFGEITAKVIRPGSFRSVGALVADIFRFLDHHNRNPKPYRWTADPNRILEKLDRAWEAMLEEIYNPIYGKSH